MEKSILIVGRPGSTKTRYLTQLQIRAEKKKSSIQFFDRPKELQGIAEDKKRALQGLSAVRTATDVNMHYELPFSIGEEEMRVNYPDSAGEQVNQIVDHRRVGKNWQQQILRSDYWVLFINPSKLTRQFDLSTKLVDSVNGSTDDDGEFTISDQGFLIELLQMMLYVKGLGIAKRVNMPKLAVVLTCWDVIEIETGDTPAQILGKNDVLPLLSEFIHSVWSESSVEIYGMAPQGKELSPETPDEDFVDDGAENRGFIILPDGQQDPDITLLISRLLA